jgi:phage-related minor tail protein
MASLRELIIKISANSQSFQSEIARASRMGQEYYRTMQNGGRQSAAASRDMRRALAEVTEQINTAKSSAMNMAGAHLPVLLPLDILYLLRMNGAQ